jgi:hypothetical protein
MPCKHYKEALMEAAACGAEPHVDLCSHLVECADCRAAFEQERSLFASIDAGLHVTANTEVPASLLPRVRAALDEESVSQRIWVTKWLVLASAAVMVAAFFTARAVWRPNLEHQPSNAAVKTVAPPLATAPTEGQRPSVRTAQEKNDVTTHRFFIAKSHSASESSFKGTNAPEVLVPHDQELLLAEYSEQWSLHKHPLLLTQEFDATILSPLQVEPIQIDELGVKLLAEEKVQ